MEGATGDEGERRSYLLSEKTRAAVLEFWNACDRLDGAINESAGIERAELISALLQWCADTIAYAGGGKLSEAQREFLRNHALNVLSSLDDNIRAQWAKVTEQGQKVRVMLLPAKVRKRKQ